MPESRHKYLYERLGDHEFQLLINALLTERFMDFVPLPLRQAEGGRDGLRRVDGRSLVYQVKWSVSGHEKDPVGWLRQAVRAEEANIRRLVADGATKYVLVTNVPSTGKPGRGTFDRLATELNQCSQELHIEMTALWREAVDAMTDTAPDSLKWSYADMLAGWDLIRYLLDEHATARHDGGLRDLVRKVTLAQWDDDERVKFSQVDIDRERITDLFVDVTAEQVRAPVVERTVLSAPGPVGGAAAYLLMGKWPFTLVRGAPGQGKSTLSQYISQAHRAAFLPDRPASGIFPAMSVARFPLRFDLSAYAAWMRGVDVFDPSADTLRGGGKLRPAAQATVECFLAELITHASGGVTVTPAHVQEVLDRVPALVVMDGLDEVGGLSSRRRVVAEVDKFCRRGRAYAVAPQVVVTTRPSAGELPEPSPDLFEVLTLNPFEPQQRDLYLRKWCAVHGIGGRDGRELRKNFRAKSAEPYIGELAGNPMQLTILLALLHQRGAATPTQRTELYDEYMTLLLAREANKHPDSVRKHRSDLLEIMPFLGWYLQSRSEEHGLGGRMSEAELAAAMRHFQSTYSKPEWVVDELFNAATDRLWALTSREQGAFEFEVVSLREYFAARFLYRFAGEGVRGFDRTTVLAELLRRPYWLNTARFYGGNATGSDVYIISGGIRDQLTDDAPPQVAIAAWTLLTDGVFLSRPAEAAAVLDSLCSDHGSPVLLDALQRRDISPLPSLPTSSADNPTWTRLTEAVATAPTSAGTNTRVRVLRELLSERGQFADWWAAHMTANLGTADERAWLAMAAACEAAAGMSMDLTGVQLDAGGAQDLLNTGLVPPSGGALESELVAAVLDGQCPDISSVRSLPAQIGVALAPGAYRSTNSTFDGLDRTAAQRRQEAVTALRRAKSPFADVASRRRFAQGERGSTFPWARSVSGLYELVGRCWLGSEIAIIGAASKHLDGWTKMPDAQAFGPQGHPAALLAQTREYADDVEWWRHGRTMANDDLSRAEWALALIAIASDSVYADELDAWAQIVHQLPSERARVFHHAAGRLGGQAGLRFDAIASRIVSGARRAQPPVPSPTPAQQAAVSGTLAEVARSATWFKVDSTVAYR